MSKIKQHYDVVIIGAGAAGLMCAIEAAKRKRKVLILDHSNKIGKKILMSGGGKCNFTNYDVNPDKYISYNQHFCKSALSRYTQWDFINLVEKYNIKYHEKRLGELFCDNKSSDIVNLLCAECEKYQANIKINIHIINISKSDKFIIETDNIIFTAESLVIATGGLSIPTMGASGFAYDLANQFNLKVYPTRPGLVPITLQENDKKIYADLAGISTNVIIKNNNKFFQEDFLFTHRGISGPAVLQISNYWQAGEILKINLLPELYFDSLQSKLKAQIDKQREITLKTFLLENLDLPKRLINIFLSEHNELKIKNITLNQLKYIFNKFNDWQIKPNGTEGYRTAEVTLGGIDCNQLSSKTMQVNAILGLYFIGECLDVTGWLGGYNFQWAWSSGWAAGQAV